MQGSQVLLYCSTVPRGRYALLHIARGMIVYGIAEGVCRSICIATVPMVCRYYVYSGYSGYGGYSGYSG